MTMTRRVLAAAAAAVVGATASLFAGAGVAGAQPVATEAGTCTINADTGSYRCFADFQAYLVHATGRAMPDISGQDVSQEQVDRINKARASRTAARTDATTSSMAVAATVVNAIFYDASYRTGTNLVMESSGYCDTNADVDISWYTLISAWNDRVNSFTGYGNCEVRIYEQDYYYGSSYGPFQATNDMGVMNNAGTSVRMY